MIYFSYEFLIYIFSFLKLISLVYFDFHEYSYSTTLMEYPLLVSLVALSCCCLVVLKTAFDMRVQSVWPTVSIPICIACVLAGSPLHSPGVHLPACHFLWPASCQHSDSHKNIFFWHKCHSRDTESSKKDQHASPNTLNLANEQKAINTKRNQLSSNANILQKVQGSEKTKETQVFSKAGAYS